MLTAEYDFNEHMKVVRDEARDEGRTEGRTEGRAEGLLDALHNLMGKAGYSASQAMQMLGITGDDRKAIEKRL